MAAVLLLTGAHTFAQSNLDDLRNKISNGSVEEKRSALFDIRSLHTEEASRIAVAALNDRNELVRATAPASIIFLPKPEAAKLLIPLLNDKAEFVRSEAAFALGEIGDNSATLSLVHTLQKDNSDALRSVAAAALGKIGDVSAIDALNTVLKKKLYEADENLRRSAARSIGQIAQILRTGKKIVVTPQNFLPPKYKQNISTIESADVSFPVFPNSAPILARILSNNKETDDVRREAAFALGAIGDPASRSVLLNHVNSPDSYLAEICKEALLNLAPAE